MRVLFALIFAAMFGVAACSDADLTTNPGSAPRQDTSQTPPQHSNAINLTASQAARSFVEVTRRLEPLAEQECRARTQNVNCDFKIVIDDRPNQPANAFQTLDTSGRPIIVFNLALIGTARNADELAFVLGHEAAHHIQGHIHRQQISAQAGAIFAVGLATLAGGNAADIQAAQRAGALVGARRYSKEFELEADALGTILTARAGYNPVRGAQFFSRIPDPGDRFLGTHPPNAQRIGIVRRTAAGL
ncbi:MAG: M48 family metallopeptidase [Paracoccaceae bacterium]